jgi:hypothetical protein
LTFSQKWDLVRNKRKGQNMSGALYPGTMPPPHHPSRENEGDMLLMISHNSRLKLPYDIDEDIDDDICDRNDEDGVVGSRKATVFQTSLNVTKICMGTGTLALPFASQVGGLLSNAIGLFVIGAWNYYSADCLLRCLEYLPEVDGVVVDEVAVVAVGGGGGRGREDLDGEVGAILRCGNGPMPRVERLGYGTNDPPVEETSATRRRQHHDRMPPPPPGTTAYGRVAWYASGPKGAMCCVFFHSRISMRKPSSGKWLRRSTVRFIYSLN